VCPDILWFFEKVLGNGLLVTEEFVIVYVWTTVFPGFVRLVLEKSAVKKF